MGDDGLQTVYIRHKIGVNADAIQWLYENHYFAIHYTETPITASKSEAQEHANSKQSTEWKMGNKLDWLKKWGKDGILVGADYGTKNSTYKGGMRVGKVQSGTDITILAFQNNQFQDSVTVEPGTPEKKIYNDSDTSDEFRRLMDTVNDRGDEGYDEDKIRLLKTLKIDEESADWVWYRDYPALLAVQPQGGTFSKWNQGADHLRAAFNQVEHLTEILDDPSYEQKAKLLAPGQLEILCNEFLRRKYDHYLQHLPVGRSLSDVDIISRQEPNAKRVLAQVTHADKTDKLTEKARDLIEYERGSTTSEIHVIFFGPKGKESDLPSDVVEDIDEYVENRHVFERMEKERPELVEEMLTVPPARKTPSP
jgi:hypothetical protein